MEQEKKKELKEFYEEKMASFGLPDFDKLSEDFQIEKLSDKDGKFLIRDVRRDMNEKLSAYLHLFENLINPSSTPLFVFTFLKNLGEQEKLKIKEVYKELAKMHMDSMKRDTIYDENLEAESVIKCFDKWQEIKKDVYNLFELFGEEFKKNIDLKERSYFG